MSNKLIYNLPQLQNLIKRDKISYKQEFLQQFNHFKSLFDIFKLQPSSENKELCELITFISNTCVCYPKETSQFPSLLLNSLSESYILMHPSIRSAIVNGLMFLTNRNHIDNLSCLNVLFSVVGCKDKEMRAIVFKFALNCVKSVNSKSKNVKFNKNVQNLILDKIHQDLSSDGSRHNFGSVDHSLGDENKDAGIKVCVELCIQLFRRNIWNDSKCVMILCEACLSDSNAVMATALNFFASDSTSGKDGDDDEASDSENWNNLKKLKFKNQLTRKSKSKKTRLDRVIKQISKKERNQTDDSKKLSPIYLILDPQGFAEKLFSKLANKESCGGNNGEGLEGVKIIKEKSFNIRLLIMNVISRIISVHKVILPNFYNYLIRYLKPHQDNIVNILAFAAQSAHDLAPPECLELLIKALVTHFTTESYSAEVITAGMNTIREICNRSTLGMDKETLSYLVGFKGHRDKGVMASTRSLIGLFREIDPEMLPKKELGKEISMKLAAKKKDKDLESVEEEEDFEEEFVEEDHVVNNEVDEECEESSEEIDCATEEELSDSELTEKESEAQNNSTIPIDRLLTDEDFKNMKRKAEDDEEEGSLDEEDQTFVSQAKIEKSIKRAKATKEERMETIMEGRKDRQKFGSKKGGERGSTTNKEKSKNKNFLMMVHKRSVVAKKKMSLKAKQRKLREHIEKSKKQY